ncbi:hypothetical protein EI42_01718 [Thermosporothrix hazakensis]|jgi:hypothetical protein|uniref:HEAT repeat protein n=1 Tax=Thermosporothrix hazakensis TaxID=644383 RepID=A0A326U8W7_THEHA|nr:HEAT repeat domain-containing protein [Thermosporothrix hazakensis]PZW32626.1 hypothetical protein EI42_01718 [Thermosporothrix hazakensis]GCE49979.1 hypothetical protein KTH_48480 [Thermosporothrix hazakensis]
MVTIPVWLEQLQQTPHKDFHWFSQEEIENRQTHSSIDAHLQKWGLTGETADQARSLLQHMVQVGEGFRVPGANESIQHTVEYWLNQQDPSQLWAALHYHALPQLFFPVGNEFTAITRALALYHAEEKGEYPAQCRLFVGLLEGLSLSELEHMLLFRPAFGGFRVRGSTTPLRNNYPRITELWTTHSRSLLRLIWFEHIETSLVHIEYQPVQQQQTIASYNEAFGYHFPLNIPVDVAELLHGFVNLNAEQLFNEMQELPDEEVNFYLFILANILPPSSTDALTTYILPFYLHPSREIREMVIEIVQEYREPSILRVLLQREEDPDVQAIIQDALQQMEA